MNHKILSLADKITLLAELEHLRRHCIRSAHVTEDDDKKFYYQVKAKQLQNLRRKVQDKWLKTDELDWCIVKSSATLKQLNNEIMLEDLDLFSDIERVADDLLGNALSEDLSGCKSCSEDSRMPTDEELEEAENKFSEKVDYQIIGHKHENKVK